MVSGPRDLTGHLATYAIDHLGIDPDVAANINIECFNEGQFV